MIPPWNRRKVVRHGFKRELCFDPERVIGMMNNRMPTENVDPFSQEFHGSSNLFGHLRSPPPGELQDDWADGSTPLVATGDASMWVPLVTKPHKVVIVRNQNAAFPARSRQCILIGGTNESRFRGGATIPSRISGSAGNQDTWRNGGLSPLFTGAGLPANQAAASATRSLRRGPAGCPRVCCRRPGPGRACRRPVRQSPARCA